MKAIVSNDIIIKNCTKTMLERLRAALVFSNPEFLKAQSMGKWTGNIQREICLYARRGDDIIIPFGCLQFVFCNRNEFDEIINCLHNQPEEFDYCADYNLYDYQSEAVEACLKRKNGVLVSPCGSGKTQMGLAIAARIGGRTLWLTHTQDLLNQSKERAEMLYGLNKNDYGTITAGKINAGRVITFATVQTLSKIDLSRFVNYWDCVIVDECAHCCGTPTKITQFYKVVNSLNARYKIGLTATPDRSDGLSRAMYALIGEKIHEVPKSAVKEKTVPARFIWKQTGYTPDEDIITDSAGVLIYSALINELCANEERNKLIASDIIAAEGGTLVLSERVAHCKELSRLCEPYKRCAYLSSAATKQAKEERKIALKRLNAGEIDCVFATYQLAKEGLDCPNLRNLVMASPIKEKNTVIQSVGRVQRKAEGKEFGIVYDYEDDFGAFYGMSGKRKNIYKNI